MSLGIIFIEITLSLKDRGAYPSSLPGTLKHSLNPLLACQDSRASLASFIYAVGLYGAHIGIFLCDGGDRKRNFALQAEDFNVKHRRNRSCSEIVQRETKCLQSLNATIEAPGALLCADKLTFDIRQRTMGIRCKIKSDVRVPRLILKSLNYSGIVRVQKLRFCPIPRANNCTNRSNCLHPICPFRLIEAEPEPDEYKCCDTRYCESRSDSNWAIYPLFKSFHKGILS